jgi:O-acetyl-ADP-ribose deacetylase (regulator of RNase III)
LLEYQGDAIVNAANTGGVGGKGIDAMVNKACGDQIVAARRALRGIEEGGAKATPSFDHKLVKTVVHAAGPIFHRTETKKEAAACDALLNKVYHNAVECAAQHGCRDVAFCILSGGLFRGGRSLRFVIETGLRAATTAAVQGNLRDGVRWPTEVSLVAFTPDEQRELHEAFQAVFGTMDGTCASEKLLPVPVAAKDVDASPGR